MTESFINPLLPTSPNSENPESETNFSHETDKDWLASQKVCHTRSVHNFVLMDEFTLLTSRAIRLGGGLIRQYIK